jgi:hypothetical protein
MNLQSKYLKYKEKYTQLKFKQNKKKMIGGTKDVRLEQKPENFPKQRKEVPPFYIYPDTFPVQRLLIPLNFIPWDVTLPENRIIPEYTHKVVFDNSIENKNPWDPTQVGREGWVDPVDIIPSTKIICTVSKNRVLLI